MTEQNHVDEDLLQELGLGKPSLEGEAWDLEDMAAQDAPPEDFLTTLDAIRLLQDLGRLEIQQNPPELEPPTATGTPDPVQQLLRLLQQKPPQGTPVDNPEAPELDPPRQNS